MNEPEDKTQRKGAWMTTLRGRQVWPLDPRREDVDLEEMAEVLGKMPRFNCHTVGDPYSVAQHSVLVMRCAVERHGPRFALRALLHDAHEWILGDAIRPIKRSDPAIEKLYEDAAAAWDVVIGDALEVDLSKSAEVAGADNAVLLAERRDILVPTQHVWGYSQALDGGEEPWPGRVEPWPWRRAMHEFLDAFASADRYARLRPAEFPRLSAV